jgi:hypothetical protein
MVLHPKKLLLICITCPDIKGGSVHTEMQNFNWTRSLTGIDSSSLLQEYTLLYLALSAVQLTDQADEIIWNWTKDGKYTVAQDAGFVRPTQLPKTQIRETRVINHWADPLFFCANLG